eukprot:gene1866-2203_t
MFVAAFGAKFAVKVGLKFGVTFGEKCIELEAHAVLGAGREHAKWSPVATAWYRLQPEVVLLQPVTGADAQELAAAVPELFLVKKGQLVAGDARQYENQLEKLRKRKDHFIFTIESTGAVAPEDLFRRALQILAQKCEKLAAGL